MPTEAGTTRNWQRTSDLWPWITTSGPSSSHRLTCGLCLLHREKLLQPWVWKEWVVRGLPTDPLAQICASTPDSKPETVKAGTSGIVMRSNGHFLWLRPEKHYFPSTKHSVRLRWGWQWRHRKEPYTCGLWSNRDCYRPHPSLSKCGTAY